MKNNQFASALILSVLSDYWVLNNLASKGKKKPKFTGGEHIVSVLAKVLKHNGISFKESHFLDQITLDFGSDENYHSVDEFFFLTAFSIRESNGISKMEFQEGVNISEDSVVYDYYMNLQDFFHPDSAPIIKIPHFKDGSYTYGVYDANNGVIKSI